MQIEDFDNVLEDLSGYFTSRNSEIISRRQIFDALFLTLADKLDLEMPQDIWDIDISLDEARRILGSFDFKTLETKISLPKEIIPPEFIMYIKVQIKSNGLVWIIHRYDADPFPSSPHAHQIDNNIKLDLDNGKCYRKRKHLYSISKKELISIRMAAAKVFKGQLPVLTV